jgi:two-component system CheB/CheR fusion protein
VSTVSARNTEKNPESVRPVGATLEERAARPAEPELEAAVFAEVIRSMARNSGRTYDLIAQGALRLCRAGSAGISLLGAEGDEAVVHWPAVAGVASGQVAGTAPAAGLLCGLAISRAETMLLADPGEHYPMLASITPPVTEAICVPIQAEGRIVGTLWAMAHDHGTVFDATDARILRTLGHFVAARLASTGGVRHELEKLKLAQAALAKSEENFRTLAESLPAKIFVSDLEGNTIYANRRLYQVTGAPPGSLLGQGWSTYVHPDDLPGVLETMERAMRLGIPYEVDYRFRTAAGYRWFMVRGNAIEDESGGVVGWCSAAIDIEDARQAQAALQAANDTKDVFLATLAHELRNPLAPIRNATRVLAAPKADAKSLQWCREVIGRHVSIMARLLDDLLDISRITRGKLELRREPVQLWSLLGSAIETSRPLLDARRHELVVRPSDECVRLHVDPVRITQVIANLLNNAAKFTPAGGRIELSVQPSPAEIAIEVTDNGVGLQRDALQRIFTMFSQVDQHREGEEGGLGIGLALVKGIVTMHGGRVEALSAGIGHGSTFRVVLPRLPVADDDLAAQPKVQTVFRPRRILVVDDNQDIAASLAMFLELEGHTVQVAHSGTDALGLARDFAPDIALLDVGMPGMDGYQLAQHLRQDACTARATLIAVTGWGSQADKDKATRAGFDHHLTKPVDPDQLAELLVRLGTPAS